MEQPRPQAQQRPARPARHRVSARRALSAVKALSLTSLLLLLVVNGNAPPPSPGVTPGVTTADTAVVEAAIERHDCRVVGSGHRDRGHPSALVRTPRGAVRQVGAHVGWAVRTGRRPGTLVAVCRDAPPPPPAAARRGPPSRGLPRAPGQA